MRIRKNKNQVEFATEENRFDLEASARWVGSDVLVSIWGGERPHIGAVALALPRPSLKDPNAVSATASVLCVLGHKEDDLVKKASEYLASTLNARVVVTAGIHWDALEEEGVRAVIKNSDALVKRIAKEMRGSRSKKG